MWNERVIDQILRAYDQCHLPGVAVGIAQEGHSIYRKGFGLANMEMPDALLPSTRMRIASLTKHFTCLAYLLLCEDGKAAIDDPITVHLPELQGSSTTPTVRQLMGHTSGLRDACDWFFYDIAARISSRDILQFYRANPEAVAVPGTRWRYNDGAYFLLGTIIERIEGRTLEDVFQARIFQPLGMNDSLLRRWDDDCVEHSAIAHMTSELPNRFYKALRFNEGGGQGGIVSTVDDMLRWLANMSVPKVGAHETWREIATPQTLANGTTTAYGLGLIISQYRGMAILCHGGMLLGAKSFLLRAPESQIDIIVMANRHDVMPDLLAYSILDSYLGEIPSPSAQNVQQVQGVFRSPTTGRVVKLFVRSERQFIFIDGAERALVDSGDGALTATNHRKLTVVIARGCDSPRSIELEEFGDFDRLVWDEQGSPGAQASRIAGRYVSVPLGTELSIGEKGGDLVLDLNSPLGSTTCDLQPLSVGAWQAKSRSVAQQGAVVSLNPINGALHLTTPANPPLRFERAE